MAEPRPGGAAGDGLSSLTYEQAETELVELINKLETGDVPLEDSLRMWERATLLRAVCTQLLTDARARLASGAPNGGAMPEASPAAQHEQDVDPWLPNSQAQEPDGFGDEPRF